MPARYARALALAEQLALEAGALLREEFHRPGGPRGHRGHADVDERAERLIRHGLRAAFPTWGYRGEETHPHERARDADGHLWLVDPNDGTAAFIRGQRGSAVSIALLRDGQPVLGVVYAPCAPDSAGDLFTWAEGGGPPLRAGRPVNQPPARAALDATTIAIVSDGAERRALDNLRVLAPARFRALPSVAYRLALAAAADGDVGVSLHTPGDWDYGGGHALLRGAGLAFVNEDGAEVQYTRDGQSRVSRCFGGPPALAAALARRDFSPLFHGSAPPYPDPALPFDFVRLRPGESIAEPGLLARAHGALLGLLVADTWAAHALAGADLAARPADARDCFGGLPGQPTVTAQEALLYARALDDAGVAATDHLRHEPPPLGGARGTGLTATEAANRAELGNLLAVDSAGTSPAPDLAEVARLLPLALLGHRWPPAELARRASRSRPSFVPSDCAAAAATLVVALAHVIRTGEPVGAAMAAAGETIPDLAAPPPWEPSETNSPAVDVLGRLTRIALEAASYRDGVEHAIRAAADGRTRLPPLLAPLQASIVGALLGAVHGRDAIPLAWRQMVLTCRPAEGLAYVALPTPRPYWPVDALALAERLLVAGSR